MKFVSLHLHIIILVVIIIDSVRYTSRIAVSPLEINNN